MTEEAEQTSIHAAIYVRVSSEDQAKGFSLESQIEGCMAYAIREGMAVHRSHVFRDDMSGAKQLKDRPILTALRDLAQTKRIQAVIVWVLDRLSRTSWQQGFLINEWEKAGVSFHVAGENYEKSRTGKLLRNFMAGIAEFDRETIRERTTRGTMQRLKSGLPGGHWAPYGYVWEHVPHAGRLVVNEQEAAIVRRIFQSVLQGMTIWGIAKQLTMEGIPTRGDSFPEGIKRMPRGHWNPSVIGKMLHYTGYIGTAHHNKQVWEMGKKQRIRPTEEWIPIALEAIIDEETFAAVAVRLSNNQRFSLRNRKYPYLFGAETLRCGRCGRGMRGRPTRDPRLFYYLCNTNNSRLDGQYCHGNLNGPRAEQHVWAYLEQFMSHPQDILDAITLSRQGNTQQREEVLRQLEALDTRLSMIEKAKARDLQAFEAEIIDVATLKAQHATHDAEKREVAEQYMTLQETLAQMGSPAPELSDLNLFLERIKELMTTARIDQKHEVLRALKVVLHWTPGQPLRMCMSFPSATPGLPCTFDVELPPYVHGGRPRGGDEPILDYLRRLHTEGHLGATLIARRLNDEQVPTFSGRARWTQGMVTRYYREDPFFHVVNPKIPLAYTMYVEQHMPIAEICQTLGIARPTFYLYVRLGRERLGLPPRRRGGVRRGKNFAR